MSRARRARLLLAAVIGTGVAIAVAGPAAAHPLGNLSVNTSDTIVVGTSQVRDLRVEDLAEIPTLAVKRAADTNADSTVSAAEWSTWAATRCTTDAAMVKLAIGTTPIRLTVNASTAAPRPGQAGLDTLRIECTLAAGLPATLTSSGAILVGTVAPLADIGWKELVVVGDQTTITGSNVPASSVSDRLRNYPQDLLSHQLDQRSFTANVTAGGPAYVADQTGASSSEIEARGADGVTLAVEKLVSQQGIAVMVLLLAGCLLLGAMHAISPGHGKTIVAAAIVARGSGSSRVRDALALGAAVTLAHTGSVLALGAALTALGAIVPGWLYPTLAVLSGLLVVGLGIGLLRGRIGHGHSHGPGGHSHGPGEHAHGPGGHSHGPGEHAHGPGEHAHGPGEHAHDTSEHIHDDELVAVHSVEPAFAGQSTAAGELSYPAGLALSTPARVTVDHDHDHPAAAAAPQRAGRGRIAVLGLVGGLTPSPSALVVLLATLAVGRAWLGFLAVIAFGVGMAATLTSVGLLAATLGDRITAFTATRGVLGRVSAAGPTLAGFAVVGAGLLLVVRGVTGAGI